MKIDLVVGNPPYQDNKGSALYDKFFVKVRALCGKSILVTKGAWTKKTGKGLLEDFSETVAENLSEIRWFLNSKIFEGAVIAGGVTIILNDSSSKAIPFQKTISSNFNTEYSGEILFYKSYLMANSHELEVRRAVDEYMSRNSVEPFSTLVGTSAQFGLPYTYKDFKDSPDEEYCVECLINIERKKRTVFIKRGFRNEHLASGEKLFLSKTSNAGFPYDKLVLRVPFISRGASTGTYLCIGVNDGYYKSETWNRNALNFLKTKTVRFMVLLNLLSQNVFAQNFKFVPICLDFNDPSLLSKSIEELDELIVREIGISKEAWNWIDQRISTR